MTNKINTSRAQEVEFCIKDFDDLPLALEYDVTTITDYKFVFIAEQNGNELETYEILAGQLSTDYLIKNVNVLDMQAMFEDLRTKWVYSVPVRMVMIVTDDEGKTYVHLIFNIYANNY